MARIPQGIGLANAPKVKETKAKSDQRDFIKLKNNVHR